MLRTVVDTKKAQYKDFAIIILTIIITVVLLLPGYQVCKRAESEALACPQGKQVSGGPGFGEWTRAQTVFLWPRACTRTGQLVVTDLAGQNELSKLQEQLIRRRVCSG